ncbi:MAG: extracellular solute-binding protein [Bacteroidetes bacterium]|nr:extracellular solute-binding protein [Bacteroidota bacterium]
MVPAGPKGLFPGIGSHGLSIPVGSKQKDAAWESIKWALSSDTIWRMVKERNYTSPCQVSALISPNFKKVMTFKGVDVAALATKVADTADKGGLHGLPHCAGFPQVGKSINKAISAIASGQMSAADAMKQAQEHVVTDLKKAGIKIDA